jgi:hypothetical protein
LILVAGSVWIVLGAANSHGTEISSQAAYCAGAVDLLILATTAGSHAAGFII